jgi:glycerophosphoryl diester phosphodiesterase
MQVIAHRGYSSRAPENTLAAFDEALRAGARALEFDIQETAEQIPVVFHDYRLDRTTDGRGRIRATPLGTLRTLDAGGWFDPRFAGEGVPTLEEALAALRDRAEALYVELKAGLSTAAVATAARLLRGADLADRATVISFDWWALKLVREGSPNQRIGFLVHTPDEFDGAVLRATEAGNAIVDCHFPILLDDPRRAAFAEAAGVELVCYTVDDLAAAHRLMELGVRGITTNQVTRIRAALAGLG